MKTLQGNRLDGTGRMNSASVDEGAGVAGLLGARNSAGILFFLGGRIQFINEQASTLLPLLQPGARGIESAAILPPVIIQLIKEVKDVLKMKAGNENGEQLESRRIAGAPAHPFLIRAVGMPGSSRRKDSVLIIIEAIRRT
jgi:hypothetical protein